MNNKVWTYNDPKSLLTQKGHKYFFEDCLHICATSNMARALSDNVKSIDSKSYIFSMNKYLEATLTNWSDSEYKLEQLFSLADKLELMIKNELDESNKNLLLSFLKNKNEVLDTLRLLSIVDLRSNALNNSLELDKTNQYLFDLLEWFNQNYDIKRTVSDFETVLKHLDTPTDIKKVIFHGFYFVTPEQQVVFEWTSRKNVEIISLNFREMKHENEFSFISNFIGPEYFWEEYENWNIYDEKSIDGRGNRFYEAINASEMNSDTSLEALDLFEFNNFIDFISYSNNQIIFNENDESADKMKVIATNAEFMNDKLQEYYPEYYKNYQNFLKFPIGFLLMSVHGFWNEDEVSISPEEMLSILGTRFFFSDNSEEWITEAFSDMKIYFKGCRTKDDWSSRFKQLGTIKKMIEGSFEGNSDQDKYLHPDAKLNNDTPFSFLPYLSLASETISLVETKCFEAITFVEDLLNDDDERIDLNSHLTKINRIINSAKENSFSDMESRAILDKIQERLSGKVNIKSISKNNITEAINFYLSGDLSDDSLVVEPLVNVDGEMFRNNKLHVTGLDEKGLPYGEYKLPWPITKNLLEELVEVNSYMKLLKYRNDSVLDITRYLLFLMFQFTEELELSYIKNYEENINLDKSFYLDLIDDLWKIKEKKSLESSSEKQEKYIYEKMNLSEITDEKDIKAAFRVNPKRGMYQLIEPRVTYNNLLQQEMLISRIGSILLSSMNEDLALNFLELIFPQFDRFQIETNFKSSKNFRGTYQDQMRKGTVTRPFLFLNLPWSSKKSDEDSKMNITDLYEQIGASIMIDFDQIEEIEMKNNWACPYGMLTTNFTLSEARTNDN